jgi:hypothetical protein
LTDQTDLISQSQASQSRRIEFDLGIRNTTLSFTDAFIDEFFEQWRDDFARWTPGCGPEGDERYATARREQVQSFEFIFVAYAVILSEILNSYLGFGIDIYEL